MIINCPACDARYLVTEEQIGPTGRSVKCGKCATKWFQEPAPEEVVVVVKRTYEPPPIAPPQHVASRGVQPPQTPKRRGAVVLTGSVAILAVIIGVSFMFARNFGAEWSFMRDFYESAGTPVDLPELTIQVTEFRRHEELNGFSLSITGIIRNPATVRQKVPELRVRLLAEDYTPLREETRPPPTEYLQPGDTAPFSTIVQNIPEGAARVEVALPGPN